jgi:hypothetical protein
LNLNLKLKLKFGLLVVGEQWSRVQSRDRLRDGEDLVLKTKLV